MYCEYLSPPDGAKLGGLMISDVDAAIARGRRWLWGTCIVREDANCTGWPQHPGTTELTVWGGTLDALRALRRERVNQLLDPRLNAALKWIRSQQLEGGGFDSCEIDYPAAETTAWVLVMMGEFAIDAGDPMAEKALSYLLRCVTSDGVVTTTPDDPQNQRVMPMSLALWALSKYRDSLNLDHRD
jgi:hypothetical protein